jgi:hypothetical protein
MILDYHESNAILHIFVYKKIKSRHRIQMNSITYMIVHGSFRSFTILPETHFSFFTISDVNCVLTCEDEACDDLIPHQGASII